MSAKVWMSSVLSNQQLGDRPGTRTKYYNHDWNPATFDTPLAPEEVYQAMRRHVQGYALERTELPEAEAVFDPKRFSKMRDIFFAGGFVAVKGKLAELLSQFGLGEGGLIPFTIYQADLVTPYPGEFFLLNFGARKNSILPEQCDDARRFIVDKSTGLQIWDINYLNPEGEVVLSAGALTGADLWFEQTVYNKIFMSDRLAQALIAIGMKDIFKLQDCRVVENGR